MLPYVRSTESISFPSQLVNAVSLFFSCILYEVKILCIVECMVSQESGMSLDAVAAAIKVLEVSSCIQMTFH
jgi:hypothetical protein